MARNDGELLSQRRLDQSAPRYLRPSLSLQDATRHSHLGTSAGACALQPGGVEPVNLHQVEKIAEAVLYEGYMLYPYRISSIKNRQRFNFGVLYPESYCERQLGSEASSMQTECLLKSTPDTRLTVAVRFLQIVRRSVGRLRPPGSEMPQGVEPEFELVDRLELAGRVDQPWQEAFERELTYTALDPASLSSHSTGTFKI